MGGRSSGLWCGERMFTDRTPGELMILNIMVSWHLVRLASKDIISTAMWSVEVTTVKL